MPRGERRSRRGWGEGSIKPTAGGKWRVIMSAGEDPVTGKRTRPSRTFDTKQDAQAWLAEQQNARRIQGGSTPTRLTVAEWCDRWLARLKLEREHGTWRSANQRVQLYVLPHLGAYRLDQLSPLNIDDWRAKLAAGKVTPDQQHRSAKVLRQLLGDAVTAGILGRNPVRPIRKPRGGSGRPKINPFSREEARAFLATAARTRLEAFWWLFLDTGARPGELLALRWGDVDLDRGTIRIDKSVEFYDGEYHFKAPKTPAGNRVVPIAIATAAKLREHQRRPVGGRKHLEPWFRASKDRADKCGWYVTVGAVQHKLDVPKSKSPANEAMAIEAAAALLNAMPDASAPPGAAPGDLVFPSPRTPSNPRRMSNVSQAFHALRERAKLAPRRMYELRHTSATLLLAAGVSLRVVADRLGHDDPGVTLKFYAGSLPHEAEAARAATASIYSDDLREP